MEFNFLQYFKGLESVNLRNPNEVGTLLFLGGQSGKEMAPHPIKAWRKRWIGWKCSPRITRSPP